MAAPLDIIWWVHPYLFSAEMGKIGTLSYKGMKAHPQAIKSSSDSYHPLSQGIPSLLNLGLIITGNAEFISGMCCVSAQNLTYNGCKSHRLARNFQPFSVVNYLSLLAIQFHMDTASLDCTMVPTSALRFHFMNGLPLSNYLFMIDVNIPQLSAHCLF